jgi:hypothetical protein
MLNKVTHWRPWSVRRCSKALAAWATCSDMVGLDLSIGFVPGGYGRAYDRKRKKADVVEHPEVFGHVGLLVNGPPRHGRVALHLN